MGMSQLSPRDENILKNLCEVLGATFGGKNSAERPMPGGLPCDPALRWPAKSMGKARADGPGLRGPRAGASGASNFHDFELEFV